MRLLCRRALLHSLELCKEHKVLQPGQVFIKRVLLRHVTDAIHDRKVWHLRALHLHFAAVQLERAQQALDQRRFARAGRPQHAENLSRA